MERQRNVEWEKEQYVGLERAIFQKAVPDVGNVTDVINLYKSH